LEKPNEIHLTDKPNVLMMYIKYKDLSRNSGKKAHNQRNSVSMNIFSKIVVVTSTTFEEHTCIYKYYDILYNRYIIYSKNTYNNIIYQKERMHINNKNCAKLLTKQLLKKNLCKIFEKQSRSRKTIKFLKKCVHTSKNTVYEKNPF